VSRTLVSEKQQIQFGLMTRDSFGAYSPHWSIPSSRRPPTLPNEHNPGPGYYEVPHHEKDLRYPHVIANRPEFDYSTLTSNVEFVRLKGMPVSPPLSISPLDGIHFYMPMPVSPPPTFNPETFSLSKGATIGLKRRDEPLNPAPGPGTYSPAVHFPSISHLFPRMQEREIFREIPETPGPGTYQTTPPLVKPPRWAGKLRVRTEEMKERETQRNRPWSTLAKL
jgi:hypothetical protein